ncbi:membrane hypothetical protein [groundwater metagenome]|uniref:Membrane-bound metal-dependent hydrolase n=1 Tax=groundwater metagenome TaxID=717931 RepID=A0A098E9I5_9ZZZZ
MNFKQHIAFGIVTGIAFSLIFLLYEGLSWLFVFPLLLAILGSVLPDIDHHASIPFRTLKIFVFILSFSAIFILIAGHSEILKPATEKISEIFPDLPTEIIKFSQIALISLAIGIPAVIILKIIKPPHRGVTHKKMFGIFIAFLLFFFFYFTFSYQNFSVISALSFLTGFFSHLASDKILFKF